MSNEYNKQADTSLAYKNQDPFFIGFNKYRDEFIEAYSKMLKGDKSPIITALYNIINFTTPYLMKLDDKRERVETLVSKYKEMELRKFRSEISNIWEEMSNDYVHFEILPKPVVLEKEDLSSLDDKTRSALEAWKLVYAQE